MSHPELDARSPSLRGECLLLNPVGGPGAPLDLLRVLRERGLRAAEARDPFDAMATLALHERHRALDRDPAPLILLLVEPDRQPEARLLVASAARYAPRAVVWEFVPARTPQLTAYRPAPTAPEIVVRPRRLSPTGPTAPAAPDDTRGTPRASMRPIAPPSLRLTHEAPGAFNAAGAAPRASAIDTADGEPEAPASRVAPLVSDEELAMLLGTVPPSSSQSRRDPDSTLPR